MAQENENALYYFLHRSFRQRAPWRARAPCLNFLVWGRGPPGNSLKIKKRPPSYSCLPSPRPQFSPTVRAFLLRPETAPTHQSRKPISGPPHPPPIPRLFWHFMNPKKWAVFFPRGGGGFAAMHGPPPPELGPEFAGMYTKPPHMLKLCVFFFSRPEAQS